LRYIRDICRNNSLFKELVSGISEGVIKKREEINDICLRHPSAGRD
jgi:hypothetical protein